VGTSLKKLSTRKSSHFCPCRPSVVPSHRQLFIWDSSPPPASPRPAIYILTSPSALSLPPAWCIEPASVSTSRPCRVCKLFFFLLYFFFTNNSFAFPASPRPPASLDTRWSSSLCVPTSLFPIPPLRPHVTPCVPVPRRPRPLNTSTHGSSTPTLPVPHSQHPYPCPS
jgi:hypothetical protein